MEEGDLSTQSIMGAFSICPTPTRSPARDDDGGERPSRHFDRSGAEWRNLPPLMVRAALRQEISRLRVSSKRFPSAPYRHAAPLEMTVLAAPLSSFRPKRSGVEKSHASIVQEAWRREISRLRVSWERFPSAPYRHAAPFKMTVLASALYCHRTRIKA